MTDIQTVCKSREKSSFQMFVRLQKNVGLHTARAVIYFLPCAQGCRGDWDSGVSELSLFLFSKTLEDG